MSKEKQVSITIGITVYEILRELSRDDNRTIRSALVQLVMEEDKRRNPIDAGVAEPVPVSMPRGCGKEDLEREARVDQQELEIAIKGGFIWDPNCNDYVDRIPEDGHAACRELTPANQRIKVARSATARALRSHIWDPNINKYVGRLPEDGEEKMLPVL